MTLCRCLSLSLSLSLARARSLSLAPALSLLLSLATTNILANHVSHYCWQIEGAVIGLSADENDLFSWFDMDSNELVTFEEMFSIYETIIEDGQVLF